MFSRTVRRASPRNWGVPAPEASARPSEDPTAARLAYGAGRNLQQTGAVYDFGGGTFDVTILHLSGNVYEVLSTAGDTFLGGDDIDKRIVDGMGTRNATNGIATATISISIAKLATL